MRPPTPVLLIVVLASACNGDQNTSRTQRTPAATKDAAPVAAVTPDAAPAPKPPSPSGFHLDPGAASDATAAAPKRRKERRRVKLTLRSTPPGARVWIDNVEIGTTPTFHELVTTGGAHRFTFVLEGYAMETYRFVPITDGVVHGTLTKLVSESRDAGAEPSAP